MASPIFIKIFVLQGKFISSHLIKYKDGVGMGFKYNQSQKTDESVLS